MYFMLLRVWPALLLLLFPCTVSAEEESSLLGGWHEVWLFRFLVNVLGYSTIIVPGYLLISYFKRTNYLDTGVFPGFLQGMPELDPRLIPRFFFLFVPRPGSGCLYPVIKSCVFGSETKAGLLDDASVTSRNDAESVSPVKQTIKLIFCAAGLQVGSSRKIHSA